jgi:Ion channel
MVHIAAFVVGLGFGFAVFLDAFQTLVLPRRPSGRLRITRLFFFLTWTPWSAVAKRIKNRRVQEEVYGIYGPLSLLLLLMLWAVLLILTFGLMFFAIGSPFAEPGGPSSWSVLAQLRTDLYMSGTTLFTLGLGDVLPRGAMARSLVIFEAGAGLGFVALVIGYLPVLYSAFSRREVSIALLDARAGSPPTAGELLRRHGFDGGDEAIIVLLSEWERWSAELLESHISYPILCYYRSQHDNQSWLSALTAILDACSLLITSVEETPVRQAQLTFAMARHALVDLALVFHLKEKKLWAEQAKIDRLPAGDFRRLCELLSDTEIRLCGDPASEERLRAMRALYEPYANALAAYLGVAVPAWVTEPKKTDPKKTDQWTTVAGLRANVEGARHKQQPSARVRSGAGFPGIDPTIGTRLHDEEHRH